MKHLVYLCVALLGVILAFIVAINVGFQHTKTTKNLGGVTPEPVQGVPVNIEAKTITLSDTQTAEIQKTDGVTDVTKVPIVISTTVVNKDTVTLKQLNARVVALQKALDDTTTERDALAAQLGQ